MNKLYLQPLLVALLLIVISCSSPITSAPFANDSANVPKAPTLQSITLAEIGNTHTYALCIDWSTASHDWTSFNVVDRTTRMGDYTFVSYDTSTVIPITALVSTHGRIFVVAKNRFGTLSLPSNAKYFELISPTELVVKDTTLRF